MGDDGIPQQGAHASNVCWWERRLFSGKRSASDCYKSSSPILKKTVKTMIQSLEQWKLTYMEWCIRKFAHAFKCLLFSVALCSTILLWSAPHLCLQLYLPGHVAVASYNPICSRPARASQNVFMSVADLVPTFSPFRYWDCQWHCLVLRPGSSSHCCSRAGGWRYPLQTESEWVRRGCDWFICTDRRLPDI